MNCKYCGEQMLASEEIVEISNGTLHAECMLRMICGSAAHILHLCPCYGGEQEEPEHMTKRESARAAAHVVKLIAEKTLLSSRN